VPQVVSDHGATVAAGSDKNGRMSYALGLVVHPTKPVGGSVRTISEFARRHDIAVLARETDAERVGPGVELVPAEGFADRLDGLVSLGGDGTMLGAMRLVLGRPVPVLGVNHGNLGFLIEVAPAELGPALDRLVEGRFTLEPHAGLDMGGEIAFNDVTLTAAEPWRSVTVDLLLDGARYGYYRGDAVIACTPTGSTAYNYAAGGPVVSPSAPSITLTPVAPMAGIARSVVLGGDERITLVNSGDRPLRWSADGVLDRQLAAGGSLELRLHPDAAQVVRLDARSHASRSRVKLSLLDLPLKPDQLLELIPAQLRDRLRRDMEDGRAGEPPVR
jgi:NAD+ kinase